ncbi:unnamed protein product [Cladocopium goreaui]|uniref:Type II methyltransferase M.NlaX (M.NlaX) (Cytosine-specific methyltransferase NlaX) n=1 Tax=Cladocopium goreaui TaxID=2562237 RepID=A0A9P1DJD8_9DINO|nr:unnamed protein product [Cladocopium goreaui]CAI4011256.1 unnamed protein product [Cladocopium goreaui]
MNINYKELKSAMADNKDCSSVKTFDGVSKVLEEQKPAAFILENVDMEPSKTGSSKNQDGKDQSNLGLVLARLQKCGYTVKTAKLRSDSFGLPQRRCRLYFFGVRQVERMNGNKVLENLEGLLEAMQCPLRFTPAPCRRLKTGQGQVKSDGKQQLAELLYPSDDARVTAELQRLQAKKLKSKTKQTDDETSARWMSTHKQLAADRQMDYPLKVSEKLAGAPWFQLLQNREKEAVCFVEEWNRERRGKGEPLISFVDISQTVTRMAQSTEDSKVIPTVLPGAKFWNVPLCRWVMGSEMLRFQGLYVEEMASDVTESEKLLADLAGNAFSSCCISAAVFALLASLQYESDSEDEQLAAISQAFTAVALLGRRVRGDQQ